MFGRGLGNGVLKNRYLPEAHTDMIFAVIGEELGLIGISIVMLGYCVLAYAGLRLALTCKDPFGNGSQPALPRSSPARRRSTWQRCSGSRR